MNIPINLFNSDNFQKLLFNCNENKNSNNSLFEKNLQFHQNIAKKLQKFTTNNKNFQTTIFNWMSSLSKLELIKIFCIDSKWLIDIIHQLLYISSINLKYPKFKFRQPLGNCKDSFRLGMSTNSMCLNSFFNLQGKFKVKETGFVSKFSNYFEDIDRDINSNLDEILLVNQEQEFLKNIKYLSVEIFSDNNNYNNIITLSYSLISNFDKLKHFLLLFSNNEFAKHYIEIIPSSPINGIGNKTFYNFSLPKWLKENFTLAELLTSYFEQIVILNYEYYTLYNKEFLPYPYIEKLNEVIDNYDRYCLFIQSYNENKMKFFNLLNARNIYDEIKLDENINNLIQKRKENNRWIYSYFDNSFNHLRNKVTKSIIYQINDSMEILKISLFKDDVYIFLEKLFFIDDKIAFTVEDFVYKKIIQQISSLYSEKIANDLMNDDIFEEEKTSKKKKKKHKKKKKEENIINDKLKDKEKDNNINNNNIETIIITNPNPKPKKEKKKKDFFLYPTNQKKTKKEKEENEEIKEQNESDTQQSVASNSTQNTINISSQQNYLKENSIISSSNSDSDNYPIFQNENNSNKNINKNFIFYNSQIKRFSTSYSFHSSRKNKFSNKNNNPLSFIVGGLNQFTNEIKKNTLIVNKNKEILLRYRKLYIDKIESLILNSLNQMKIQFDIIKYGSYVSGLSIESSDIDFMIKIYESNILRNVMFYLVEIFESEKNKDIIEVINPIYTASVPVIKLGCNIWKIIKDEEIKNYFKNYRYDKREIKRLKFDISFFEIILCNKSIKLPSENILHYINENIQRFPFLIDIIYILKRYMLKEGLNESYKGGISSYSIFLLVLAYIKSNKGNINISLGSLLIEIFTFYSNFCFYNHIIYPGRDDYIYQFNKNYNENILIDIRDPITELNVAHSSFRVSDIQYSFGKAAHYLVNNLSILFKNKNNETNFTDILSGLLNK